MRTFWPLALRTEIASDAPDVVLLARLDRKDGVSLGFTSSDLPCDVLGLTYLPDDGMTLNASQMGLTGALDTVQASGSLRLARISGEDVRARRLVGAILTLMLSPRSAPAAVGILQRYEVASVRLSGGMFAIEGRGAAARTRQESGDVTTRTCPCRRVGDARCKASMVGLLRGHAKVWTLSVNGDGLSTERAIRVGGGPDAAEFFTFGTIQIGGVERDVKSSSFAGGVTTIALRDPLGFPPVAGTEVVLTAGCNRRLLYNDQERDLKPGEEPDPRLGSTCTEWQNAVNFRGFWDLPGTSAAFDVADKGKE